jgi:exodeoxyribonuclease V beta subunit
VGDIKQSIYRFRGGQQRLFDYVAEKYSPYLEVEELNRNYRSSKEIVEFVNDTFIDIYDFDYKKQYYSDKIEHSGYVNIIEDEKLKDKTLSDSERLYLVIDRLKEFQKIGIDFKSIAILVHQNDDIDKISYLVEREFGIEPSTETNLKLINSFSVQAVINLVKYLYFKENIYLENFQAMLEGEQSSTEPFSIDDDLIRLVYKIAFEYQLIDDDMIKFLEVIKKYKDSTEFVYNIDNLDETISQREQKSLKILTIHKSKGLEFEHVILLDALKGENPDKDKIIFNYGITGVELKSIEYKTKNREIFDNDYKLIVEEESRLSRIDSINTLYVAMTRAKNSLTVIKKDEKSIFEPINLKPTQIGKLSNNGYKTTKTSYSNNPIEYSVIQIGKQDDILRVDEDREESNDLSKRYFGIALHYTLEIMDRFTIESLKRAILITKSLYHTELNRDDFVSIYKRIKLFIENDELKELLKDVESINKEQLLSYNGELKRLDLLLETGSSFIIIDYKTSQFYQSKHKNQLLGYKEALESISDKKVLSKLCYINEDKINFVDI